MTRKEFDQIICELLNIEEIPVLINSQIYKFTAELDLTYKEICQALYFFIKIENGKYDPKYGIGIVPYVIDKSRKYFKKIKEEKEKQIQSVKNGLDTPDIILKVKRTPNKKIIEKIKIEDIEMED